MDGAWFIAVVVDFVCGFVSRLAYRTLTSKTHRLVNALMFSLL